MKKTSQFNLNIRNKLVKCYIWSIALYDSGTWRLQQVDQRYLESFKCDDGEGGRSVGTIVWKIKKYDMESRRIGIPCIHVQ
jgi:hypothetical protein